MSYAFFSHKQSFGFGDDPSSHLKSHRVLAPLGEIYFKVRGTGSFKQEQSCYYTDPAAQLLEQVKILMEEGLVIVAGTGHEQSAAFLTLPLSHKL